MRCIMKQDDNTGIIRPHGIPASNRLGVGILGVALKSSPGKARINLNDVCIDTVLQTCITTDVHSRCRGGGGVGANGNRVDLRR